MRVPVTLVDHFKTAFEPRLAQFLVDKGMLPDLQSLRSDRYLSRSVAPHVHALSDLFNRIEGSQTDGIDTESYWTEGKAAKNRRLAYFLSFMPCNLFRVASVWSELHRLGFKWPFNPELDFRGLEWGAGTASGACGIVAGEQVAPLGMPVRGNIALIEQSKSALSLGTDWFEAFSPDGISARPFHRRLNLAEKWLPEAAPKFHFFVMSYFLNESEGGPEKWLNSFVDVCKNHLEEEGLIIIVEPALKLQSRKLLTFREQLLKHPLVEKGDVPLKVLLPCLGHQACGALKKEDDWCHEEISWWRPEYLRQLDGLTGLDRKTLPFSYLVIQKTKKSLSEIFPTFKGEDKDRFRLVSASWKLSKKTHEFFICGQEGKRRARMALDRDEETPDRGDILQNAATHGDPESSQVSKGELLVDSPIQPR